MHFMSSVRMDRKRFSLIVVFFSLPLLIGSGSETLGQSPAPEIEWQKAFGGPGSRADSVQQTTDGGYIVSGGTLFKTDRVGNLLWEKAFGGRAPGCIAATDVNGDEAVNIADPVSLLNFLFAGGPPPVQPFPECGPGSLPGDNKLGCENLPEACQ